LRTDRRAMRTLSHLFAGGEFRKTRSRPNRWDQVAVLAKENGSGSHGSAVQVRSLSSQVLCFRPVSPMFDQDLLHHAIQRSGDGGLAFSLASIINSLSPLADFMADADGDGGDEAPESAAGICRGSVRLAFWADLDGSAMLLSAIRASRVMPLSS